jgi:hypothetical protein
MTSLSPLVAEFAHYFNNEFTKNLDFEALHDKHLSCEQQLIAGDFAASLTVKDHAILDHAHRLMVSHSQPYSTDHLPSEDDVIRSGHLLSMRRFIQTKIFLGLDPVLHNELWEPMLLKILNGSNPEAIADWSLYLWRIKVFGNAPGLSSTVLDLAEKLVGNSAQLYVNQGFQFEGLTLPTHKFSLAEWAQIQEFILSSAPEFSVRNGPALPCKTMIIKDMMFSFHRCRIPAVHGPSEELPDDAFSIFYIRINGCEVSSIRFNDDFNEIDDTTEITQIAFDIKSMLAAYENRRHELVGIDLFVDDLQPVSL